MSCTTCLPPALAQVGYLASYEGMGRARLECRVGCQCAETVLDGHWTVERASISLMHEFYVRGGL